MTLPVALVHIIRLFQPFPQYKSNFSQESLYFLSCGVIPGLSREDSCDICVSYRANKNLLGLQGHHNSCEPSTNYGALADLIESFESDSFLRRLDVYAIPSTTAMTEIAIKILVELLSIAMQQAKLGRLNEYCPLRFYTY